MSVWKLWDPDHAPWRKPLSFWIKSVIHSHTIWIVLCEHSLVFLHANSFIQPCRCETQDLAVHFPISLSLSYILHSINMNALIMCIAYVSVCKFVGFQTVYDVSIWGWAESLAWHIFSSRCATRQFIHSRTLYFHQIAQK